jgi:hypothetical protein
MATAWNDVTGARLVSRANTKSYDTNYDAIFGKKEVTLYEVEVSLPDEMPTSFTLVELVRTLAKIKVLSEEEFLAKITGRMQYLNFHMTYMATEDYQVIETIVEQAHRFHMTPVQLTSCAALYYAATQAE